MTLNKSSSISRIERVIDIKRIPPAFYYRNIQKIRKSIEEDLESSPTGSIRTRNIFSDYDTQRTASKCSRECQILEKAIVQSNINSGIIDVKNDNNILLRIQLQLIPISNDKNRGTIYTYTQINIEEQRYELQIYIS